MRAEEAAPITAQKRCYCGHGESQHDDFGVCLSKNPNFCYACRDGFTHSGYDPQEPTTTEEDGPGGSDVTVERHPSYGQVSLSRVQGGAYLYGSDFRHQHFITMQIYRSELHRQLSGDWPMARERVIEIAMSEAQWAAFVSSVSVGSGVQCTIQLDGRGMIPDIAAPKDRRTQFSEEMQERFATAQEALSDLEASINFSPLSEKKKTEFRRLLDTARASIGSSTDFVADQFDEHMERTVEQAKSEVNAYAEHTLRRLGNEALAAGGENPLLIEGPK